MGSRSISVSETRISFTGPITLAGTEGSTRVICNAVILKTVQRSVGKILNTQQGGINGMLLERCHDQEGHLTKVIPQPCTVRRLLGIEELTFLCTIEPLWSLLYEGFGGSLPNFTGVFLAILGIGAVIEIPVLATRCTYRGTAFTRTEVREGGTAGNTIFREERIALERTEGSFLCPRTTTIQGSLIPPPNLRLILV